MDFGIKDKVALVTAASRGLGKAVALQLSRERAKVAICSRNETNLLRAREEIVRLTGGPVLAFPADVTKKDHVEKLIERVVAEFGSVDVLVANAGGPPAGLAADFSPDDYRAAVELNLMSTITLVYACLPPMKKVWPMLSTFVPAPLPRISIQ